MLIFKPNKANNMDTDFLRIEKETEQEFQEIAKKLFNDFIVENHESKYRLMEIEFYWNSRTHKDSSTYERKYVNPKQGEWFFHYSGVDIALRNESTGGYGGILIRKIYCFEDKKIYKGPMVCAMKIFSGTNAFTFAPAPRIVEYNHEVYKEVEKGARIGLGNNAKESKTDKLDYRFYIS